MKVDRRLLAFALKTLKLPPETPAELRPLSARGSDRSYFRLRWEAAQSAIAMHYSPQRLENAGFADIAAFLGRIGVPVPRVLGHDPEDCFIVMQDLGNDDLWSARQAPWEMRRLLYQKALAAIRPLHAYPARSLPEEGIALPEAFGPALYRWERDYFKENFVIGFCGIHPDPAFARRLEAELEAMAGRLNQLPRCLVHRDLQSQNIMLLNGEPFFIDFQGMRLGTLFYDLGSLLYDPYVYFPDDARTDLLGFYYELADAGLDWDAFRKFFLEASAQRLMQALGAYIFLGVAQGLQPYLRHVGPGLANLCGVVRDAGTLPNLQELLLRCRESRPGI
jgi:aminoglycoside/choline kinase family phosphotransferase